MVCGTTSDAGKSTLTAGLCRLLARRGVSVAPFKGQNMSLNAMVTGEGGEIGRAQWLQAVAAGAEPEVAMNPVLLKPTGERSSQVIVLGRPAGEQEAAGYYAGKEWLVDVVDGALDSLRRRFDVVVCEGAGSPAEINLLEHDIVNLGLAARAGIPAVLVGDIERGGVFAHLFGTVAILPDELARAVRGFVINRFRGDPDLLGNGPSQLEARTGVPTLGVLPFLPGLELDAEDGLAVARTWAAAPRRCPRRGGPPAASALQLHRPRPAGGRARRARALGGRARRPGTARSRRAARHPLHRRPTWPPCTSGGWSRRSGRCGDGPSPPVILGLCGGFQMLGSVIEDPAEGRVRPAAVEGLGWLPVRTVFDPDKVTRLVRRGRRRVRRTGRRL